MSDLGPLADQAAAEAQRQQSSRGGIEGGTGPGGDPMSAILSQVAATLAPINAAAGALLGQGGMAGLDFDFSSLPDYEAPQREGAVFDDSFGSWVRRLASDPTGLVQAQMRLFALDYYGDSEPTYGKWDATTLAALQRFAADAQFMVDLDTLDEIPTYDAEGNRTGTRLHVPFQQVLFDMAGELSSLAPEVTEQAALGDDPIAVQLSNPQNLTSLLDAAYARVGKRPSTQDRQAFVVAFHAMQRSSAEAALRAREQATGGSMFEVTQQPSPEIAAEGFAHEQLGDAPFVAAEATPIVNTLRQAIGEG